MDRETGLSPFSELTLTNTSPTVGIPARKLSWGPESPSSTPHRNSLSRTASPLRLKLSARGNLIRRMNSAPSPTTMALADAAGKENAYLLQHCPVKMPNQPEVHDTCSQDSGCAEDSATEVRFAVPSGFAPKKSIEPSPSKSWADEEASSPSRVRKSISISCSPGHLRQSPHRTLKSLSFSSTDSLDDGFSDLTDLENLQQDENAPIALGSLLTGQLLTKNVNATKDEEISSTPERLPLRRAFSLAENHILTPTSSNTQDEKFSTYKRPRELAVNNGLLKRRKACVVTENPRYKLQRSVSENAASILHSSTLSNLYNRSDLIADFSRPYVLPFIPHPKHTDLTCITGDTLASVMRGEFKDSVRSYTIIDCRYPYEFEGGHIRGSLNLYTCELIESVLFNDDTHSPSSGSDDATGRDILIFHCEFSIARGPSMYRLLRRLDRRRNTYPELQYPEVYLLQGGYQIFQSSHSELCDPTGYRPMQDPNYESDLRKYRAKSTSFGGNRANVKRLHLL